MRFDPAGVNYHIENCQYIIDVLNIIAKKYFGLFSEPHRGSTLLAKNKKLKPNPRGVAQRRWASAFVPERLCDPYGVTIKNAFRF